MNNTTCPDCQMPNMFCICPNDLITNLCEREAHAYTA